jgi:tetratricopeptide (TPR) repeat protein
MIMKFIIPTFLLVLLTSCDYKSSEQYNTEAEALEKEEKYEEAILLLDKAIEKDPTNLKALINRAVDKSILEDYEGAIQDYTIVLSLDDENTLAYLNRGKNKARVNDNIGAIDDFEDAISTKGSETTYITETPNQFMDDDYGIYDVEMEEIKYERGIVLYEMDSLRSAFNDFNFCIQEGFQVKESLNMRGNIYLLFGMKKEACKDYKKGWELGDVDSRDNFAEYCN